MKQFVLDNDIYLLGSDKQIWSFYYHYPDMIGLGECMIGHKREEKAQNIATECDPKLIKELHKYITDTGCWIKGNHLKMINLLSRMFDMSEDDIKKSLRYNDVAIRVTNSTKLNYKGHDDYNDCLSHLQEWNWDEDRVIK